MPAWREHSPRCRVQRAGVRKSPKNEPAGQRRAAGRLWGFGHAAVLAEDHFAPIGESWSRRWWRTGVCARGRGPDLGV